MSEHNERIQILEMIESGVISAEEGARLLRALEADDELEYQPQMDAEDSISGETSIPEENDQEPKQVTSEVLESIYKPEIEKWRRWWMIPLWIGVGITIIGGLLMFWAYQVSGFSFWFACSWLPFLLGIAMMAMAWGSRTARWLHLRVQQEPGEWPTTIAFSFPLPLRFAAWFLRTFGGFIPNIKETGVDIDQLIQIFENNTSPDTPFFIEVNEGEHGEKVQIYIG